MVYVKLFVKTTNKLFCNQLQKNNNRKSQIFTAAIKSIKKTFALMWLEMQVALRQL